MSQPRSDYYAQARLSEGFCPLDGAILEPLTEDQAAEFEGWWSPPCAHCPKCNGYPGFYKDGSGVFVSKYP